MDEKSAYTIVSFIGLIVMEEAELPVLHEIALALFRERVTKLLLQMVSCEDKIEL